MSKPAHSHKPSMDAITFKSALEDGNEDMAEGYWWVRHNGIVRVAEWRQEQDYRGKWRWSFFFTNCVEADPQTVEVLERIEGPSA